MDVYIVTYRDDWSERFEIETACSSEEKAKQYIDKCLEDFRPEQREEERNHYGIVRRKLDGDE